MSESDYYLATETTFQEVVDLVNFSGSTDLGDKVQEVEDWNKRRKEHLNGTGSNDDTDRRVFTEELITRLKDVKSDANLACNDEWAYVYLAVFRKDKSPSRTSLKKFLLHQCYHAIDTGQVGIFGRNQMAASANGLRMELQSHAVTLSDPLTLQAAIHPNEYKVARIEAAEMTGWSLVSIEISKPSPRKRSRAPEEELVFKTSLF